MPSTDNREEDQPDKTDTGQHGQQSDLNVPKPKLGMEQSIQVKKWEALAEPEPAPSPECRSTSGEIPAGGHDSPSFALSPCGMESDVKDECPRLCHASICHTLRSRYFLLGIRQR